MCPCGPKGPCYSYATVSSSYDAIKAHTTQSRTVRHHPNTQLHSSSTTAICSVRHEDIYIILYAAITTLYENSSSATVSSSYDAIKAHTTQSRTVHHHPNTQLHRSSTQQQQYYSNLLGAA